MSKRLAMNLLNSQLKALANQVDRAGLARKEE